MSVEISVQEHVGMPVDGDRCLRGEPVFENELDMVVPAVAFCRVFSSLKLSLKSLSWSE